MKKQVVMTEPEKWKITRQLRREEHQAPNILASTEQTPQHAENHVKEKCEMFVKIWNKFIDREVVDREVVDREVVDREVVDHEVVDHEVVDHEEI